MVYVHGNKKHEISKETNARGTVVIVIIASVFYCFIECYVTVHYLNSKITPCRSFKWWIPCREERCVYRFIASIHKFPVSWYSLKTA